MFEINKQIGIYIHFPWCVRKCPYCDFNSHPIRDDSYLSAQYYQKLIADFDTHLDDLQAREIISIFIGGGTPSLFKAEYLDKVLQYITKNAKISTNCEITLEMNPGTVERGTILSYQNIGINRISLGVQSFQDDKLRILGRIHNCENVYTTIDEIKNSKISNFNIDIMHGLPNQSFDDGYFDITQAIAMQPTHISWYQLTIEPNTLFAAKPPKLPAEEILESIEIAGKEALAHAGFKQYEVSAFAQNTLRSIHNSNYWMFGDYIGIGAGAHSKITNLETKQIKRVWKHKHPKIYTQTVKFIKDSNIVTSNEIIYEFMLNALRLKNGFSLRSFEQQTLLSRDTISKQIQLGIDQGFLMLKDNQVKSTIKGYLFLNDCINLFS
ncbi:MULTISPECIES: radical SAM family heme chaperone HemW [Francisella]|uniref:Heme chaperone HemW n=1 Tax=Francisella opportunistica TaxID=2016517 RepID=A0A345JT75_9GAMM|nr:MULTISPECIES: radical SAM family heme chaperone HemW [Francisella]APC92314.1 Radical SAM family enzyme, similar to coproporphyrinogen III oxidase, oxygen-independent [Francisella sp. MA067296]AXH30521.1 radical SAM protein [Francisella opportunistica]AXH32162.1 YggW family oxidoreductase [Francisella opportunistica]AXH33811.1 YggW family oxidoreductase [Francisella opportunistica]